MARAKIRRNRRSTDIADAIVAEWYRILPEGPVDGVIPDPLPMDSNALTGAFNQIIATVDEQGNDVRCQAVPDEFGKPFKIAVPLPPREVTTRQQLLTYLEDNDDFRQGMGSAVLFGCGR
jgi:hypothetical protein